MYFALKLQPPGPPNSPLLSRRRPLGTERNTMAPIVFLREHYWVVGHCVPFHGGCRFAAKSGGGPRPWRRARAQGLGPRAQGLGPRAQARGPRAQGPGACVPPFRGTRVEPFTCWPAGDALQRARSCQESRGASKYLQVSLKRRAPQPRRPPRRPRSARIAVPCARRPPFVRRRAGRTERGRQARARGALPHRSMRDGDTGRDKGAREGKKPKSGETRARDRRTDVDAKCSVGVGGGGPRGVWHK